MAVLFVRATQPLSTNTAVQEKQAEPGNSPRLGLLQLDIRVNSTDKELISNLNSCKERNLPKIRVADANDRTLVICGSGPSLEKTWGLISPDADVMALNGAYKYLRKKGIVPKYFSMLDSRAVNVNFLEELHADTLFLLASQCAPEVFDILKGWRHGIFHLSTPTTMLVFPDEPLYIGGGGTIGLTSLASAIALGYRSVMLLGFDSSYSGSKLHVAPQPQNVENLLEVWVEERKYNTTHAMAGQTMDFFPFYNAIRRIYPEFAIHLVGDGLFYDFVTTNNNPSTRESELAKYAAAYQEEDYGMTLERLEGLDKLISQLYGESYLDVSTGRGETMELARKHGFKQVDGTETVEGLLNEHVIRGILPNLDIPDKSYDVVSLIEVIEHLVPEDVEPTLRELTRIAKYHILISAAIAECWIGGVNLHPSAMALEKWDELFTKVWGDKVYRVGNLGSSPAWRVDF